MEVWDVGKIKQRILKFSDSPQMLKLFAPAIVSLAASEAKNIFFVYF
jgi:hypothetical protein